MFGVSLTLYIVMAVVRIRVLYVVRAVVRGSCGVPVRTYAARSIGYARTTFP